MEGDFRGGSRFRNLNCFNPRPRMEGDLLTSREWFYDWKFQSTPPHGGRPVSIGFPLDRIGFNPRPRMEGDRQTTLGMSKAICFNPRPRMEGDY